MLHQSMPGYEYALHVHASQLFEDKELEKTKFISNLSGVLMGFCVQTLLSLLAFIL